MRLKDEYQEKTEDRIIKRTYGLQSEPAVVWWRESGRWLRLPVNRQMGVTMLKREDFMLPKIL